MAITEFIGKYRWLSNFWPCIVYMDGDKYPTTEHAYQAAKTLDMGVRDKIRMAVTPARAKKLGRQISIRPDWEDIKLDVMEKLIREKFTRYRGLRDLLVQTGDEELIEGNWWGDTFWGVCRGKGQNHLGKILMKIRKEFSKE